MDYPKALYRAGNEFEFEGVKLDIIVVADEDAELEAREAGCVDLVEAVGGKPAKRKQKAAAPEPAPEPTPDA